MADPMQQARELLAAEYERDGRMFTARTIRVDLDTLGEDFDRSVRAIAAALRAAPEGFVMVPVKPTPEMLAAVGNGADGLKRRIWRGMLAARPQGVKDA